MTGATLFDDGKDPGALRTIGEVAKALGIRQHVLRYWEDQFPMLRPLKRGGGRRYYRSEDVALVEMIDRLVHKEGYTLKGARMALGAKAGGPAAIAAAAPLETAVSEGADVQGAAMRDRLIAVRQTLAAALSEA